MVAHGQQEVGEHRDVQDGRLDDRGSRGERFGVEDDLETLGDHRGFPTAVGDVKLAQRVWGRLFQRVERGIVAQQPAGQGRNEIFPAALQKQRDVLLQQVVQPSGELGAQVHGVATFPGEDADLAGKGVVGS